jgi:hypothetical protein
VRKDSISSEEHESHQSPQNEATQQQEMSDEDQYVEESVLDSPAKNDTE